jgi:hypothetical protein
VWSAAVGGGGGLVAPTAGATVGESVMTGTALLPGVGGGATEADGRGVVAAGSMAGRPDGRPWTQAARGRGFLTVRLLARRRRTRPVAPPEAISAHAWAVDIWIRGHGRTIIVVNSCCVGTNDFCRLISKPEAARGAIAGLGGLSRAGGGDRGSAGAPGGAAVVETGGNIKVALHVQAYDDRIR